MIKSMKIDTHNSFDLRFSSISNINRLIIIDYFRLQSILSIIEFHRLGTPGVYCLGTDHYFSGGGGGGGGMKNIEKNCLQGLKRQNKLFANIICIKKIVCIEVRETFLNFLTKTSEQHKERLLVVVYHTISANRMLPKI